MLFKNIRSCFLQEEFLDTDCLLKLDYGNLVLRRQAHLFLGCGVLASIALLLLFWLVIINLDFIASGQGLSGNAARGDSYDVITTMIECAPPPSTPKSIAAHSSMPPSAVGKIIKVSQKELPLEHSAATQSQFKQLNQNQEVQGVQSAAGSAPGSGTGGDSSALQGFGEDGALFGVCEKMPAFLEQKKPLYPESARIAGTTGKVFVKVLIGANGHPLKAIVMKRMPETCTAFDGVALKAVLESTYSPAVQNGQPVKVWCIIPISFRLT